MFSIYALLSLSVADDLKLEPRQNPASEMKQDHTSSFICVDRYSSRSGPFGLFNIVSTEAWRSKASSAPSQTPAVGPVGVLYSSLSTSSFGETTGQIISVDCGLQEAFLR